ncbi:MAG: hypothetical protein HKN87_04375 [Saprospiraceae bacterium]|nr:hypothetical protein [Saprospiraceae bacterium]
MIRFKVFGVDPTDLSRFGKMINESMKGQNIAYDIEHVMDVDEFIQYGITSIPSLIMHTEVKLEERDFVDPERFSQAVRDLTVKIKDRSL